MNLKPLNLAIIGCGAIFQNNHLPALLKNRKWEIKYLIDHDTNLTAAFSKKTCANYSSEIESIPSSIDVCLVATPNFLHTSQSISLLEKGFHVVCEKPMALNWHEATEVSKCINETGKHYFIVHQKRFHANVQFLIKELISKNEPIQCIDISLGNKFGWQSRTNFYDSPQKSGGGVFIDLGVHLLDLLTIIDSRFEFQEFHYSVDKNNLLENAVTSFGKTGNGQSITLRVSRMAELSNSIKITTESGVYLASLNDPSYYSFKPAQGNLDLHEIIIDKAEDPFYKYWDAIADTISGYKMSIPPSDISSGLKVTSIVEQFREKGIVVPC